MKILSCTRGEVNSASLKILRERKYFKNFFKQHSKSITTYQAQRTPDLYWFGLLTYSSPQATVLESSFKKLVKYLNNTGTRQSPVFVLPFLCNSSYKIISPLSLFVQHNLIALLI